MQYVLIKDIKYSLDSFSQDLKWWNASDFILSGVFFFFLWTPDFKFMDCTWIGRLRFSRADHTTLRTCGGGGGVCVGFLMCECLFWQLFGCFGNMCTCIYYIFLLILDVYLFLFVTCLRTTSTNWKLNCSK
jgi:hypothetical protein